MKNPISYEFVNGSKRMTFLIQHWNIIRNVTGFPCGRRPPWGAWQWNIPMLLFGNPSSFRVHVPYPECIRIEFLKNISPVLEKNWEEKLPISLTLDMSLKCSTRPSYVPEAMSCTRPPSTPSTLTFPLRPAVDSCAADKDLPSRNLLRDIVGKPCWPSRCAMFHATNATTPPSSPLTFAMKRAELLEQAAMLRYEVPL